MSLEIGLLVVIVTGLSGTTIGALAGYFRHLDNPLMRLMDALMAFPAIPLAIVISAVLGSSVVNVIIALSIATTPHSARIVRGSVLVVREMEYVEAGRALGAGDLRLLFGHVLVNPQAPLIVRLTYVFAIAILAEAVLSYIAAHAHLRQHHRRRAGFHGERSLGDGLSRTCHRYFRTRAQPTGRRTA
ncbi:MAG: ABC transporter permease [Acetobacteraceae bacterium]